MSEGVVSIWYVPFEERFDNLKSFRRIPHEMRERKTKEKHMGRFIAVSGIHCEHIYWTCYKLTHAIGKQTLAK